MIIFQRMLTGRPGENLAAQRTENADLCDKGLVGGEASVFRGSEKEREGD
jgi:hypothetical protein